MPGTGLVSFTSDSANVTLLRDYLRASSYQEAAALIDFVRAQPLGAIVDSTPAIMDAPSLGLVDAAYTTFENQHAGRRSLVFYGESPATTASSMPWTDGWGSRCGDLSRSTCSRS